MNNTTVDFNVALPEVPFIADIQTLYHKLSELTDYRKPKRVRYALPLLVVVALLAKFAGQNTFEEIAEWAKGHCLELAHFLGLTRSTMPHAVTFSRVVGDKLNCVELETLIGEYFKAQIGPQIPPRGSVTLRIDGKTLRGTIPKDESQLRRGKAPEVLAILNNVVLGTLRVSLGSQGNIAKTRRQWGHTFSRALFQARLGSA